MTKSEEYFEKQRLASLTERCGACGHNLAHGHIYLIGNKWYHRACYIDNKVELDLILKGQHA